MLYDFKITTESRSVWPKPLCKQFQDNIIKESDDDGVTENRLTQPLYRCII